MAAKKKSSNDDDKSVDLDAKSADPSAEEIETVPGGATSGDDTVEPGAEAIELPEPEREDTSSATTDGDDSLAADDNVTATSGEDSIDATGDDAGADTAPVEDTPEIADTEMPAEERPEPITEEMSAAAPPPPPAPADEPKKSGGFFPALLGGVIAAGIGYGAATYMNMSGAGTEDLTLRLDEQDQALADLKSAMPEVPDLAPLNDISTANGTAIVALTERLDAMEASLSEMGTQITELEKRPISEGVSESAIQAYEAELARLQQSVVDQRAEVEAMIEEAQNMEAAAAAQVADSTARAALTRILSALDEGMGFADPLEELAATGVQIPDALSANVDGVQTMADLRGSFPPAARAALQVTRGAGNGSVSDFFKTQLGIRSLEPKEGDDPDAILSRAEAAVTRGDLSTALSEIEALPEPALAELSAWQAAAQTRLDAVAAANGLMADLNSN